MNPFSFSRPERLRRRGDIDSLFASGESGFCYPFKYVFILKPAAANPRVSASVLISVPKKLHKRANKRNLIKRRTREAYRASKMAITPKLDEQNKYLHIAFIYVSKQADEFKTIRSAVEKILGQISGRI